MAVAGIDSTKNLVSWHPEFKPVIVNLDNAVPR